MVQDVMTKRIFTVHQKTPIRNIWRAIFKRHINAIPVIDKRRVLIGLITREDLLKPLYPDYREFIENLSTSLDFDKMEEKIHELGGKSTKDVMNRRVIFTRADTPIMRALSRMITQRVHQLPVLSDTDTLVGLLTKGDVFYALFQKHLLKSNEKKTTTKKRGRRFRKRIAAFFEQRR